jgi:hypothetical protein
MSFLQNIGQMLGGADLERIAGGNANFDDGSPDHGHFQNMLSQANPSMLEQVLGQVAGQMDGQAYRNHITPGVGGTNPLGMLGQGGLSSIASMLLGHLMNSGGYSQRSLLSQIPGLQTTDPNQMDERQVAAVADYTRQNHPGLFGKVAALLGRQNPGMLQGLLGNQGMAAAAQQLAGGMMGR